MEEDKMTPELDDQRVRWLLREMWLGCDGRWFLNVAERYGFDVANEMNKAVGRGLARASMRKLSRVTEWERPGDMAELARLFRLGYEVYHPAPECEVEFRILNGDSLLALFHKCPVKEKVERGGGMQRYECACPLSFEGWMEALEIQGKAGIQSGPEAGPPCRIRIDVDWQA
jgi:hypothetical protein